MRPIIGISCSSQKNSVGSGYIRAIEHAKGVPIVLPVIEDKSAIYQYLEIIDGLMLSGGVDINPLLFGEEPHPKLGNVDAKRDVIEIFLTKEALKRNLPIFAICRGIQTLNVAAGSALYQDISQHPQPTIQHSQNADRWHGSHTISIKPDSLLFRIVCKHSIFVNSYHHQAVKEPAEGFIVSAHTKDKIIEAIESPEHDFVLGVQFHPENMWERDPDAFALFEAFVDFACRRMKSDK